MTNADRLSALGLLGAWADFGQEDAASWERYDCIWAETLFRDVAGVSPTLYQQLVSLLLHVLPMAPGYDCSAAAALSCFHVFALQFKGAFDVRWCRGSITERIFDPWSEQLVARNVTIRGSSRVTFIEQVSVEFVLTIQNTYNETLTINCDSFVLSVVATAAKELAASCPLLAELPQTQHWNTLRGITCAAVRLFLQPEISFVGDIRFAMVDSPVIVCGPRVGAIPELSETGFCVYDLQRLQDRFAQSFGDGTCFVIEVDYFRADPLANLNDDDVAALTLRAAAAALGIRGPSSMNVIRNFSVVRARNAVSHFCVGSASSSPTGARLRQGIYICGDWIDRKGARFMEHQKVAVVTGKQAVQAFAEDDKFTLSEAKHSPIIPAAPDSPQVRDSPQHCLVRP